MQVLEYAVKSVHRFLEKRQRLYRLESLILDFIQKMLDENKDRGNTNDFRFLKKELSKLLTIPVEKKMFEYFDFITWTESKIEKRSFAEIVQKKTLQEVKKQQSD